MQIIIIFFISYCIKVLNNYYYNSATLSCFTSLLMNAYINEFVSYNVMDSDFLEKQNKIEEIKEEDILPIVDN